MWAAAPVRAGGDLAAALTAFDRTRRPQCERIGRTAAMTARIGADLRAGWRQPVRNTVLRLLPPATLLKLGSSIVGWRPPAQETADDPPASRRAGPPG